MTPDSIENIPQELRDLPQWVCHRDGEKVPIDPKTGRSAKANDPTTWGTFEQATGWAAQHGGGIGFEFTADDPFCGIDLDHVIGEGGTLTQEARAIVDSLDTYTEVSPSGTGLHLIARAAKPKGGSRRGGFEMYDSARYFRMTGNVFDGHSAINDRQEAVEAVHTRHVAKPQEVPSRPASTAQEELDWDSEVVAVDTLVPQPPAQNAPLDAEAVIERMRNSPSWPAISRLLDGDTSDKDGNHSDADMALCNHLAYYCDRDERLMDEMFRRSGLMRDKWDEVHHPGDPFPTYGAHTVHKATSSCRECYSERHAPRNPDEAGGASDAAPVATFRIVHASDRTGPHRRPLRPALIEGLMRRGGKCLIVGPMKSHKSMEAIHLSLALATGGKWFGHSCQRVRTLYVNVELDEDEFHDRLDVVRRHMGLGHLSYEDTLDTVSIVGRTIDGRRTTVEGLRRWIEAQPGARGYDVVAIDPIYKLEEGEETHETVNEMLLQLDVLRRDLDCSIVYVHHSAKGGAANKTVYELARGSGDFGGDADLVVGISELMPLREGTDAWDRALSLGIGSPEHSGYRVQFGPRSFADRDNLNVYKTWPLFTVDEWDALGGISQRGDMAHEKGGSATRQACQAKRNLKDEAVTKAVRILQGRGEQPTRKAVYEAMDRTCGELGIDRPTFGTFKDWTRRSDGRTHWRTGAGDALRECARSNDGRARYEDGSPVFLEEDAEEDE